MNLIHWQSTHGAEHIPLCGIFLGKHSQKERGEIWRKKVDKEVRATNIVATRLLDGVTMYNAVSRSTIVNKSSTYLLCQTFGPKPIKSTRISQLNPSMMFRVPDMKSLKWMKRLLKCPNPLKAWKCGAGSLSLQLWRGFKEVLLQLLHMGGQDKEIYSSDSKDKINFFESIEL